MGSIKNSLVTFSYYFTFNVFCYFLFFSSCGQPNAAERGPSSIAAPNLAFRNTQCGMVPSTSYSSRWYSYPITMTMSSTVPTQYADAIKRAANSWNSAFGQPIFQFTNASTPNFVTGKSTYDNKNTIYWIATNWPDDEHFTAVTYRSFIGSKTLESDILFNSESFRFGADGSKYAVDVESVALHEFGHVLGFNHNETDKMAIMFPDIEYGQSKRSLANFELDVLSCYY